MLVKKLFLALAILAGTALMLPAKAIAFDSAIKEVGGSGNASNSSETGRWRANGMTIEAQNRKPYVVFNGTNVYTGSALSSTGRKFFIQDRDWKNHVLPILKPQTIKQYRKAIKTIAIDPGHGGKDPGKISATGMREKTYALDVCTRLKAQLQARGFNVVMTRSKDVFIDLEKRPAIANDADADLFISIHFNSAASKAARGLETWMLTPVGEASFGNKRVKTEGDRGNANNAANLLLAYKVQSSICNKIDIDDRGVKCANFAVLRDLKCPGILVECGFFTNPAEAALIATSNRRDQLAIGIAEGVLAYARALNAPVPVSKRPTREDIRQRSIFKR